MFKGTAEGHLRAVLKEAEIRIRDAAAADCDRAENWLVLSGIFLIVGTVGRGQKILKMAGEALYGERWQSPLARDLGTTDRNLRYWCAGTHTVPADLDEKLIALLDQRDVMISRLMAHIAETGASRADPEMHADGSVRT